MKKIIVALVAILTVSAVASAQPRTIGLRGTWGAEISYQHSLGSNFVEADLGLFGNGFFLTGIYDFVFASEGNFNFYAGPGASLGVGFAEGTGFNLGIAAQIGVEYNFDIPLTLSLDWRPVFNFFYGGFGYQGFGLGIKYRF